MRKLILGAVIALVLPAAALAAQGAPSAEELARQACKTEKSETGTKTFKRTYAARSTSKAMKACIAKQVVVAKAELKNAANECKAEREADPVAFAEYGTNANGKNAYGKCVSSKVEESGDE